MAFAAPASASNGAASGEPLACAAVVDEADAAEAEGDRSRQGYEPGRILELCNAEGPRNIFSTRTGYGGRLVWTQGHGPWGPARATPIYFAPEQDVLERGALAGLTFTTPALPVPHPSDCHIVPYRVLRGTVGVPVMTCTHPPMRPTALRVTDSGYQVILLEHGGPASTPAVWSLRADALGLAEACRAESADLGREGLIPADSTQGSRWWTPVRLDYSAQPRANLRQFTLDIELCELPGICVPGRGERHATVPAHVECQCTERRTVEVVAACNEVDLERTRTPTLSDPSPER